LEQLRAGLVSFQLIFFILMIKGSKPDKKNISKRKEGKEKPIP